MDEKKLIDYRSDYESMIKYMPWFKAHTAEEKVAELPTGTVYDYLYQNNKNYLEHNALIYFDKKITYRELFDNIEKAAKALKEMGVKKGDIVTFCTITTPEFVYLFYALARIGAVVNMIDPRTSVEGIKNYIKETKSEYVISLDNFIPKVDVAQKQINKENDGFKVKKILSLSPLDSLPYPLQVADMFKKYLSKDGRNNIKTLKGDKYIKYPDFIKEGESYSGKIDEPYEKNKLFAIIHTGGTTGTPKGVMHSHDSFNALAHLYKYSGHDIRPGHTFLNIMPPFIAYGLSAGVHMPISLGITNIIVPVFNPKEFDKLLIKYHPNHWAGVPSHLATLFDSELLKKPENWDMSYLVCVGVGGDGLNPKVEERINKFLRDHNCRYKIAPGYGMTEVNSAFSTVLGKYYEPCSGGIPFARNDVKIMDPDTKDPRSTERLPIGSEGEIYLSTPTIMLGYYNNKQETDETLITDYDGKKWIRTGDLGKITPLGNIQPLGRKKDIIIRHDGFKVFSDLIEKVISKHPAVANCKVVGIKDFDYSQGELPKVHVILRSEYKGKEKEIEKELIDLCNKELPEYSIPVAYKFRDDFPLTPNNKVDSKALRHEDDGIDYRTENKFVDSENEKEELKKHIKRK